MPGYTLHEDSERTVIATGFGRRSTNSKTGGLIQVWILAKAQDPIATIRMGRDSVICGDCKHAGGFGKRSCYVRIDTAPLGIWRAWTRGRYPMLDSSEYARVFAGKVVRWGAYGDPVHIPAEIIGAVSSVAKGHTGYTHQWKRSSAQAYRQWLMASVDTPLETMAAKLAEWRTFRVRGEGDALMPAEIMCPASPEGGHKTQCADCKLCDGARDGDRRKDISIIVHGIGKRNYKPELIQIGGVM